MCMKFRVTGVDRTEEVTPGRELEACDSVPRQIGQGNRCGHQGNELQSTTDCLSRVSGIGGFADGF